jgi:acetyl-CoA decarbonylase/synthase complex subunit delta
VLWESLTAAALLQAGADILVMRHPAAIEQTRRYINSLRSLL